MATAERVDLWRRYIAAIDDNGRGRPGPVRALWERAISECFLHEAVWWEYTDWVKDRGLKLEAVALCSRSVRNHPQSVRLWTEYLFAAEWAAVPHQEVERRILNRIVSPRSMLDQDANSKYVRLRHF